YVACTGGGLRRQAPQACGPAPATAGSGIAQCVQAWRFQGRVPRQASHRSRPGRPASPQARQRAGHRPSSRRRQRPSTPGRQFWLTGVGMLSRLPEPFRAVRQETAMPAVSEPRDVAAAPAAPRHDWSRREVEALFDLPFTELLFRAATVHRAHFDPAQVQGSTLRSVKTGGCPEDCAYCPQAQRYHTGVEASKLMSTEAVLARAKQAKDAGASRFCMGAAWRSPKDRDIPKVAEMVAGVKALGLETCATLGMLTAGQAAEIGRASCRERV